MISAIERIKAAAVDPALREAARAIFQREAPRLFEDQPRKGIRVSDAGKCVRQLWNAIHVAPEVFSPEVQLDNLDNGTLIGCWRMCLLAASLEAEDYTVELEPEVSHDGTPGHIDLYFAYKVHLKNGTFPTVAHGVVEHKVTMWPRALTDPAQRANYQCLQAAKYAAAKGVEDFCIVTSGPASPDKMREDWYKLSDWQMDVAMEYDRLSAALGDQEPVEDAKEAWRCKGCAVIACQRNPLYIPDVTAQLEASL